MSIPDKEFFSYLPLSQRDKKWGLYVTGVGSIRTSPGGNYPPTQHPDVYHYIWPQRRVLTEYQLIYITHGEGEFESQAAGTMKMEAGNLVLTFPGDWHRYRPFPEVGWSEYWIGFNGLVADQLIERGFFSPSRPVLATQTNETIRHHCLLVLDRVRAELPGLQQILAADVMAILGAALAAVRIGTPDSQRAELIRNAKIKFPEVTEQPIQMGKLAESLALSSAHFRRIFKQYVGMSQDLKRLEDMGFELGNHSASHPYLLHLSTDQIREEIATVDRLFANHGLTKPISHAYPGGHHDRRCLKILKEFGYSAARRGNMIEFPILMEAGSGRAYHPYEDDPLLIPSALVRGPNSTVRDVAHAVEQAKDGKIAVLTFHGVPDVHPHCSTEPEEFEEYVDYLRDAKCTVIAFRDLAKYVDLRKRPADPYESISNRLGLTPTRLKCESLPNPRGVDSPRPRLSWISESTRRHQLQAAYQVLVASSRETLDADEGDVWDSGKVASNDAINVFFAGKALASGKNYWWKVRC